MTEITPEMRASTLARMLKEQRDKQMAVFVDGTDETCFVLTVALRTGEVTELRVPRETTIVTFPYVNGLH